MSALSERRNIELIILDVILFSAIFNDLLRIPGTSVSFFRMMIPIGIVFIIKYFYFLKKYVIALLSLMVFFMVQSFAYVHIFGFERRLDLSYSLKYAFLFFSIWIIFALIHIIKKIYPNHFYSLFSSDLMLYLSFLLIIAYILSVLSIPEYIDNRNNYACMLALCVPWLLIQAHEKKHRLVFFVFVIIVVVLFWGDSKAALLGVLFEAVIVYSVFISKGLVQGKTVAFLIFSIIVLVMVYNANKQRVIINGYNLGEIFETTVSRLRANKIYDISNGSSSVMYRTNAIKYMFDILVESKAFGVGIGNSARVLTMRMNGSSLGINQTFLAPHFPILEIIDDFGIIAILLVFFVLTITILTLFKGKALSNSTIYSLSCVLGFFIWNISTSTMYSLYFVFIVFAWLFNSENDFVKVRIKL